MRSVQHGFIGMLVMAVSVAGIGCGSLVPIDDASEAMYVPELVGHWQQITKPGEQPTRLMVRRFNDAEYYVELSGQESEEVEADTLRLRVYITRVKDIPFINAQVIESSEADERRFFFYTYYLNRYGTLTLREVHDMSGPGTPSFETSDALRAYLLQHRQNAALYGDAFAFEKVD